VVKRGLGSCLPPAELARWDSGVLVEMKCLFFHCAGGEKRWRKSGVFISEKLQPDVGLRPVSSNHRQRRAREGRGPVARPVTCDRTCLIARGALWTPIESRVQRVRSNGEARPVTAMALSNAHCYYLSCSDRTRPVTLTGASGHHDFHCDVL
jgi:hypothetical protein